MICFHFALVVAAMSLPTPFSHAAPHWGLPQRTDSVPVPELHLPDVPRLEIVIPPPRKAFDNMLPSFIAQPTPALEIIIPHRAREPQSQPTRYRPATPASITVD